MTDQSPIQMRLHCPARLDDGSMCGALHLDIGEFATKPHHTHACQACGNVWRPAIMPTVGVQFLPGFKNAPVAEPIVAEQRPAGRRGGGAIAGSMDYRTE